jgi:hypothetical protein
VRIYSRRITRAGQGCSTGLADGSRETTSACDTSERRVRSIDSLKGGIDQRLVVTGARCIDDPWTGLRFSSHALSTREMKDSKV